MIKHNINKSANRKKAVFIEKDSFLFASIKFSVKRLTKPLFRCIMIIEKGSPFERLAKYELKVSRYIWRCGRLTCFYSKNYHKDNCKKQCSEYSLSHKQHPFPLCNGVGASRPRNVHSRTACRIAPTKFIIHHLFAKFKIFWRKCYFHSFCSLRIRINKNEINNN